MASIADKLREARALIERGWTRGTLERDGRVCAVGAISKALTGDASRGLYAEGAPPVAFAVEDVVGAHGWLGDWNDKQKSKKSVLAAFDKAIELAEADNA